MTSSTSQRPLSYGPGTQGVGGAGAGSIAAAGNGTAAAALAEAASASASTASTSTASGSSLRSHRATALPPPRPTPNAPLPPPPPGVAPSGRTGSRFRAQPMAIGSGSGSNSSISSDATSNSTSNLNPNADFDPSSKPLLPFGGNNGRSRAVAPDQSRSQTMEPVVDPSIKPAPSRSSSKSTGRGTSVAALRSLYESSSAVAREQSTGPRTLPKASTALAAPTMLGHMGRSMSTTATPTSTSIVTSIPTTSATISTTASTSPSTSTPTSASVPPSDEPSPSQQASTLGPSGTIRGRPRGFTVGALPSSLGYVTYSASGRRTIPAKSRPRSLLSNEIVPGLDLAESRSLGPPILGDSLAPLVTSSSSPASLVDGAGLTPGSSADARTEDASLQHSFSSERSEHSEMSGARSVSGQSGATSSTAASSADGTSDRRPSLSGRSRSGSSASLLQQVKSQPKSHASFVIAVVGHGQSGKSTVIKKGLRQFGLSKPHVLSEKVTSHSTACVVDQEQRTIEVLEIDASVLLNGPGKRFAWPKFLPRIDAVILCYDAARISSFRGMSELLENFAISNLSTVMLACKSEVHPKAVDPYYASDMASVYNVGLAECTVQSEEGKKRMRDCFSYLVKEVAKARTGKSRRAASSTVPTQAQIRYQQQLQLQQQQQQQQQLQQSQSQQEQQPPPHPQAYSQLQQQPHQQHHQPSTLLPGQPRSSQDGGSIRSGVDSSCELDEGSSGLRRASFTSSRARGDSGASSYAGPSSGLDSLDVSVERSSLDGSSPSSMQNNSFINLTEWRNTPRKMSNATVASNISDAPSYTGSQEDGLALQESLTKARIGLQNARSAGGYVSIDELWDKLFHAAVSGNDERFQNMFMVFYRGFTRPIELLRQMVVRFDILATGENAEGVINRFALIRLTKMLGEWVLSYPGDLSSPETYALLIAFYSRLQQNISTTHTASLLHAAIEAASTAPDIDAVWSKAVDHESAKPPIPENVSESASVSSPASATTAVPLAAVAAFAGSEAASPAAAPSATLAGEADLLRPSKPPSVASISSGSVPSGKQFPSQSAFGDLSEPSSRNPSDANLGFGGSESSLLVPTSVEPPFLDGRHRSASDVTTSSNEGGGSGAGLQTFAAGAQGNGNLLGASAAAAAGNGNGNDAGGGSSSGATSIVAGSSASTGNSNVGSAPAPTSPSIISTLGADTALRPLDQKAALRSISNALMEVDDEVIAAELTRLEWMFFTAIRPRDLLRHILVPRELRDGPVARSIAHFNYVSAWVCSMILAQGKTKHRARMLEKFYNIASILRHDNNYGSLNSVLGGLSKTAVHRLKHTRELLKGKPVNKTYQSLVRLMSSERSNAAYRLALENSEGPTIPYVGVHLQDILSISDGNPSKRSDGLVHWRKFSLMDEAVMAVVRCQQYDRVIKPNPAVERLIVDVPVMDDEALYERSLVVEPRSQHAQTLAGNKIKDLKSFLSSASAAAAGGGN